VAKASKSKTCSESGCGRATHARGLCQKHYDQSRARDTRPRGATAPEPARPAGRPRQATETTCSFPGCTAAHHARGYCKSHYSRARRRGKSRSTAGRASQCEIAGCSRLAVRNKRCAQHLKVVKDGPRHLTKVERLGEIRKRHELMRREIERIRQSFESEKDE
jgi:hypothetical protein